MAKQKAQVVPSTFKKLYPDYLDPEIEFPHNIYRYDTDVSRHLDRYYARFEDSGKCTTFISGTSLASRLIPKGYGYMKWLASKGEDAFKISDSAAWYGTIFHKMAMRPFVDKKGYDFTYMSQIVNKELGLNRFNMLFPMGLQQQSKSWKEGFERGLIAWWKFCRERLVKLLAVELPIVDDDGEYGNTLDWVAIMKYNRKEYLTITDLKSKILYASGVEDESKKYYDQHLFQLELQKRSFMKRYPKVFKKYADGDPDKLLVFNWNPVNYRIGWDEEKGVMTGEPKSDWINQTDNKYAKTIMVDGTKKERRAIDVILNTAKIHDLPKPPSAFVEAMGGFKNLDDFDWAKHIQCIQI